MIWLGYMATSVAALLLLMPVVMAACVAYGAVRWR